MHSTNLQPAGKGVLLEHKSGQGADDGEWVRTKVVEPVAVRLVDEGVYTGYSVGIARPRIDRDMKARGGRIVGGKIVEISLVDRPALPTAKFAVLKAAGAAGLQFIGKVVTLTEPESDRRRGPRIVKQLQRGMHITAHVRAGAGQMEAIEGLVTQQTRYGFTLDVRGYDRAGGDRAIDRGDVVALYKGSVPVAPATEDRLDKAAGLTHSDHTEDSVADDETKPQDAATEAEPDGDDGGVAEPAEKAAAVACANCGNTGFDGDKCDKCGTTKAVAADATKVDGKTKTSKVSKKVARVAEQEGAFVVLKGEKVVGGPYPTTEEAQANAEATNNARKAARTAAKAATRTKKLAKATKAAAAAQQEIPWAVKRLHDTTCAAYAGPDLAEVYPATEGGSLLGKGTRSALYEATSAEIKRDNPDGVAGLGRAISALNDLRKAEKRGGADVTAAIAGAHDDLNTVFKLANGLTEASADGLPKPADNGVVPGQFRRPYIRSGHAAPGGSGHGAASIPQTTHPVHASDFGRGTLTEGHQRYLSEKVSDLHDGLSSWRPELCRMDARGSMAFDRQPSSAEVGRSNSVAVNAFKAVDNQDTAGPTPRDLGKTKKAPGEKAARGVRQITAAQISDIIAGATRPLLNKMAGLEGTVNALASAPDTTRSAYRGVTGIPQIDKVGRPGKVQKRSARSERKSEKVTYMRSLATSGDASQRIAATDWLASRGLDAD